MIGRASERAVLALLLDGARTGMSGALVLAGEAGVGKTTLLDHAQVQASDFRVLRVAGFESERDLAFAALHRLILPVLDRRMMLPVRQRLAIESAFGLLDAPPADRFLVGLATLSMLADAAVAGPLLCIIDDASWLDDESIAALAFAARRLHADRLAMLFAVRNPDRHDLPLDGLPVIELEGLPPHDAIELLRSIVPEPIDGLVAERVVAETGGSPLALVELGGSLSAAQLGAGAARPEPLPVGRWLETHYLHQVRALPDSTQDLLLLASAAASCDQRLIDAAASILGVSPEAADAAERSGLLTPDSVIRLRHPLVRSAVYNGASSGERRRIHAALAAAAGKLGDIDRQAWHRGASAAEPDELVAEELAAAGERAIRRGGCAAAASFFTRAAELSVDPAARVERALAAAQRHLVAGFRIRARHVIAEFADGVDDPLLRAKAARLEGAVRYTVGETSQTVSILIGAAQGLHHHDIHTARDTLLQAMAAARITGEYTSPGETELDVALVARAMPLPSGVEPTIGDLFLDGEATLFIDGVTAAAPTLRRAMAAIDADDADTEEMLRWLGIASWAAGVLGDSDAARRFATRLEKSAREHGAIVPLSVGLTYLGFAHLFDGSLAEARAHLTEREELLAAVGRPADVGPLLLMAWAGDERTHAEAAAVVARARETHQGWMLVFVHYALTVLELGLGNYAAALSTATKNFADNPMFASATFLDVVEAAVRSGNRARAQSTLDEFVRRHGEAPAPLASALCAGARALLAGDVDAEPLYLRAIDGLESAGGSAHIARSHLLFGEWLRRQKRRVDARVHLHTAHDIFSTIGAGAFADRASRELAATGERARRRVPSPDATLTPQESQIARLAATGATNPEIAHQLFLSASTVDYHLRKVYRKLNLSSRRQLARALHVP
jgi:DNA-binding CsgD family transcriptional regulator